jgi:hypothetical protein
MEVVITLSGPAEACRRLFHGRGAEPCASIPRSIWQWRGVSAWPRRLAVFFTWTYPGNVATKNWTVAPANWEYLRTRWEYSHAANAGLAFASFCLMTLASLTPRR